ncbi:MAG: hypothetical protein ACI4TD_11840, partial [Phocaeicola sp.]
MRITCDMVDWQRYAAANPDVNIDNPQQLYDAICQDEDGACVNTTLAPFLTEVAKENVVREYAPDYVNLYYVDYRDDLDNNIDLLDQALQNNSLQCVEEQVYDWWDYPEGPY